MSWAESELAKADLGDKRRNKRLIKIVEDLAAHPHESVPQASRDNAAMQGIYDFWANRRIEASEIIEGHIRATIERTQKYSRILVIQDKTELDLGKRKRTRGIGAISNQAGKGLHVHNVLAVTESGVPLGLLEQKVWTREKVRKGKGSQERKRKIEDKESYRWIESLETSENLISSETEIITIADREADIYELFAHPRRKGSELLIRASHNRKIKKGKEEIEKLWSRIKKVEPCGEKTLELQRTPRRKARQAILTVRYTTVEIEKPKDKNENQLPSKIKIQAILAEEKNPPVGEKAVSWLLLTTLPISTDIEAFDCLEKYSYRWLIERFHYVLKSGCGIEELQLERAERMEKALATYSLVAWRLLWITYEARKNPERKIEEMLDEDEFKVLCVTAKNKKKEVKENPTLREGIRLIASLGGFLGRKGDGNPGVKTLWRGWQRLQDMVIGWQIMKNQNN